MRRPGPALLITVAAVGAVFGCAFEDRSVDPTATLDAEAQATEGLLLGLDLYEAAINVNVSELERHAALEELTSLLSDPLPPSLKEGLKCLLAHAQLEQGHINGSVGDDRYREAAASLTASTTTTSQGLPAGLKPMAVCAWLARINAETIDPNELNTALNPELRIASLVSRSKGSSTTSLQATYLERARKVAIETGKTGWFESLETAPDDVYPLPCASVHGPLRPLYEGCYRRD